MVTTLLFILGAIVGSFINVVGLRWGTEETLGGRSHCTSCGKNLSWYELVPVLSFLFLRGKCRKCGAKISWQYILIELWTGLVFTSVFNVIAPSDLLSTIYYLLFTLIFSIYIVIFIYDWYHKIIPDELVYTAILLSVVSRWLSVSSTLDWLAGPILFAFFGLIWLLSKGRAMGFGDAKLGLSVGLLLGATQGFSAIVLAFWIGALGSLIFIFLNKVGLPAQAGFIKGAKGLTMKSEIPFAPFIIISAWISFVFNLNIINVALF